MICKQVGKIRDNQSANDLPGAAIIQVYIYRRSDAGTDAYNGDPVDINVWAQTGSYVLLAISEIFASITSLEYAFTKAPKNMRSLVMAFSLFQTALASAIGEAFNPLSADPLLVANYALSAGLAGVGGILFWLQFRQQDKDEDKLNMLPTGKLVLIHHLNCLVLSYLQVTLEPLSRRLRLRGGEALSRRLSTRRHTDCAVNKRELW
jgi:hypothetical protein